MNDHDIWPLVIVSLIAAGSTAYRRLVRAAQPLRLLLAEKGERLLVHPKLPKDLKEIVRFMLDSAFGNRPALLTGLFLVPMIAIDAVLRPSHFVSFMRQISNLEPDILAAYIEIERLHDRIMLANHPILFMLIEFEILTFLPLGILSFALIKGRVPVGGDRDTVMNLIETKEAKLWMRRRAAAA
jgi:hypothetical protein